MTRRLPSFLGALLIATGAAMAQDASQTPSGAPDQTQEGDIKREEVVVVTASKVESTLVNAPATMSVITPDVLATSPAQNYGDLLRAVPGMNVIQMSARDINLTSRAATSTLTNSQLTLLDGRSIYLDFFGLVLWDLVPSNMAEIKQIEVVRGPASAVWGANALTGVVNIITKSPRELAEKGTGSISLSAGTFNRDGGSRDGDSGTAYGGSFTFAQAPSEKLAFKLSAGYFHSDPFSRPTGFVPRGTHPLDERITTGGAPYPADRGGSGAFANARTKQPKVDLRIDQELSNGGRLSYSGGLAGTSGIIHTGIGPFNLQPGSKLGYGRIGYSSGAFKASTFANVLDAEAPNLLLTDPATLQPVQLNFKTKTFDFELGHYKVFGAGGGVQQVLSYGGNARRNQFDITLTPNAEDRWEFGAYVQDEIFTGKFRFTLGGRVDKFGNLEDPVFSPRLTAMFKPTSQHAIRVSFNRAFRSPSAVNNYLDQDIFSPTVVDLRALSALAPLAPAAVRPALTTPFFLRVKNVGNEVGGTSLKEESVDAFEVAYTGTFGDTTLGLALYQNDSNDNINFTQVTPSVTFPNGVPPFDFYNATNAPALIGLTTGNVPVPGPQLIGFLNTVRLLTGRAILLPRTVSTYLNLGPLRQRGLEASINHNFTNEVSGYANYSFQDTPEALDPESGQLPYPTEEIAVPSRHRFNAGVSFNNKRFLGQASVTYAGEAYWSDVLSREFHGFTDAYTMVNASLGVRWLDGRLTTTIKGTNLTNEKIQQHIFGDIIKRSIFGEVKVDF